MSETRFYDALLAGLAAAGADGNRIAIDNVLAGTTFYRKTALDRPLKDLSFYLAVLASGALGFAYHNGEPGPASGLLTIVGRNALEVLKDESLDFPLRVSVLDAVCGEYRRNVGQPASRSLVCRGTPAEKAEFRSRLVTSQLPDGGRVLLVGAVTEFVRDLLAKGTEVLISDLSPDLAYETVHGVPIINAGSQWTLAQLSSCDAALVTGSTFSNDTVDAILDVAAEHGVALHFYLETGGNFAAYLMSRGATSVVAEQFPFYDLPGETRFEVFER